MKNTFFSLSDCSQCNYFGTLSCKEENGINCNCKSGYTGIKCQSCESEDLVVSGTDGIVNSNGQGVKCSKFVLQIKIVNLISVKKAVLKHFLYIQVLIQ